LPLPLLGDARVFRRGVLADLLLDVLDVGLVCESAEAFARTTDTYRTVTACRP
jgi:hypothetical protein